MKTAWLCVRYATCVYTSNCWWQFAWVQTPFNITYIHIFLHSFRLYSFHVSPTVYRYTLCQVFIILTLLIIYIICIEYIQLHSQVKTACACSAWFCSFRVFCSFFADVHFMPTVCAYKILQIWIYFWTRTACVLWYTLSVYCRL